MTVRRRATCLVARGGLVLAILVTAVPCAAQTVDSREEARRLREASALEWRGRIGEAQDVLAGLLTARPTSSGALFGLERILRNQGRVAEILPYADRFLEEDPEASGVRYMKLRVLAEVDSLEAMEPAARAWFRWEPGSPDPYREVARLYQRTLGTEAALAILEEGRRSLGDPDALALEMGDLLAELGRDRDAVAAWSRSLAAGETELDAVLRRVRGLQADGGSVAGPLVEALTAPPVTAGRRADALRVLLVLGTEEDALALARSGLDALPGAERRLYLAQAARDAEEAGRPGVAAWALSRERELAPERERTALDLRLASLALQAGDTAGAVEARTRLSRTLPAGSPDRRRVMAELIRVEAAGAPDGLLPARLAEFRREFPEAPELDELTALVAGSLAETGRREEARALTDAAPGPLTALEGGFIHFLEGDVAAGEAALSAAVPGLAPTRATEVLRLLALLNRLQPGARETLGAAAAHGHHGRWEEGIGLLEARLPAAGNEDRPGLLSWAAELALQAGDPDRASLFYEALVQEYPEAREYPQSALALARIRLEAGDAEGARSVLEALILGWPENPVVPAARRELQRIRSRGGEA